MLSRKASIALPLLESFRSAGFPIGDNLPQSIRRCPQAAACRENLSVGVHIRQIGPLKAKNGERETREISEIGEKVQGTAIANIIAESTFFCPCQSQYATICAR
jgi:hypothetical protein